MQSPLTRMLWRLKTLCRWRGGVCSEFTGDGYSIGLVSVGELAHRPSGTYSREAKKHQHRDKTRRWTISCYKHEHKETIMGTTGDTGLILQELTKNVVWAFHWSCLGDMAGRHTQLLARSQCSPCGLLFI